MISTPSYPACRANPAARTKSFTVCSTPRVDSARGVNGVMGDFRREAEAINGWYPYRPACSSCRAIRPPAWCTASVITRCLRASRAELMVPEVGSSRPVRFGENPPVTISPTPPRARSA